MNMTFDPPPTADRARNKPHLTAHRLPSFTSSRQSQSQEPPAYTTDDILAYQHQKYSKLVSWLRIALSAIILVISVAIIACSGSSLRAYSGSTFAGDWWLPIWPLIVDLRPTHAVLACGIVLMVASLLYLAAALFPSPHPKFHLLNIISTALSLLCLFTTIFTTAFATTINSHLSENTSATTLQSWTCKWSGFRNKAPNDFSKICTQSTVAINLVILLIVLEVIAVATVGFGWWTEMKIKKETAGSVIKLEGVAA